MKHSFQANDKYSQSSFDKIYIDFTCLAPQTLTEMGVSRALDCLLKGPADYPECCYIFVNTLNHSI